MHLIGLFTFVGVGISIIERRGPLLGHDTPNAAHNTYTLNYEEPQSLAGLPPRYVAREY